MQIIMGILDSAVYCSFLWLAWWVVWMSFGMIGAACQAAWASAGKDTNTTLEWLSEDHCHALAFAKHFAVWAVIIYTVKWIWSLF